MKCPSMLCVAVSLLSCAPHPDGYSSPETSSTGGTAGGTSGGADAGTCPEGQRLCPQPFGYGKAASSVSLHGSFTQPPWSVAIPMAQAAAGGPWTATVPLPWGATVQYKFQVDGQSDWIPDPANPDQVPDGLGGMNSQLSDVSCASWSCAPAPASGGSTGGAGSGSGGGTTASLGPFDWHDAILYFAFTDRFENGDPSNDGQPIPGVDRPEAWQGGDWAGIVQQIEAGYFDRLGINALWISPPAMGPQDGWPSSDGHQVSGYHGYWPYDFTKTEPHFGTLAELQALVAAAHSHGIRVLLDFAMHHVIQSSPVYAQNPGWFWPLANQGASQCVCGAGCAWDGTEGTECWFTPYLPAFDYTQSAPRDDTVASALWWVQQTGADALRLDAVKQIDSSWLTELRSQVNAQIHPPGGTPFYLIGETFSGDRTVLAADVSPTLLDGQFDFPLRAQLVLNLLTRQGSMQDLGGFLAGNLGYYGSGAIMGNFIGNHDVPRAIQFANDTPDWTDPWALGKERAWSNQPQLPSDAAPFERLGNAFAVLFTLPGIPLVYYGDEIGLNGAGDPDNRHPMPWSGYSAAQQALLAEVGQLAKVRAAHPALRRGRWSSLWSSSEVLVYQLSDGSDTVDVAINRSDSPQSASGLPGGPLQDQLTASPLTGPTIQLAPRSAVIATPG
ncbi:MAG: alpha-amylase family glycosyl hydrolase [Myxococcales bacterium]